MGDIKRKRKKYKKPKKPFDKQRIEEENNLVKKYGLRNKKEIWKAESEIGKIRRRAKALIPKTEEEKKEFFEKLNKIGLNVKDISDVLALKKEDWFERRLQTFVFKKGLANTINQARQMITHRKILVKGKITKSPSFIVTKDLEGEVSIVEGRKPLKKEKEKPKNLSNVEKINMEDEK